MSSNLVASSYAAGGDQVPVRSGPNGDLATTGWVKQSVPDHPTVQDLLNYYYNFDGIQAGDFVTRVATSNGQVLLALSSSPWTTTESSIKMNVLARQCCALEFEASTIRARGMAAVVTLGNEDPTSNIAPDPIDIVAISQSSATQGAAYTGTAGATVTVVLNTPLPGPGAGNTTYLGDWVSITGIVDNRLNYGFGVINFISADRKTITFSNYEENSTPSLALPVVNPTLGSAKLYWHTAFPGSRHGLGVRFSGTSQTSAAFMSTFGEDTRVTGTLTGSQLASITSSAPAFGSGGYGQYELRAQGRFRLEARPLEAAFLSRASSATSSLWSAIASFTDVKPAYQAQMRPKFRILTSPSMSRPICKIVSISKSGTTTATVNTDQPHGLVTGNIIVIKGVRDQTNFANIGSGAAVTVTGPYQFTFTHGSAVTATSYGGIVGICNGSLDISNVINVALSTVTSDANGWVTALCNTTISGLNVGYYVQLAGVRVDTTGADTGLDGAWEVANLSSSTIILKPIYDIFGLAQSPIVTNYGLTSVGGMLQLRVTVRAHDVLVEEWTETRVQLENEGENRVDRSIPVNLVAVAATVAVNGNVGHNSATGTNPVSIGARARNVNPSAASASGNLYELMATMLGALVVRPHCLPEATWDNSLALTSTTAAAAKAAGAAGIRNYVTAIQAINTGASAVDISILDGATVKWTMTLQPNAPFACEFPTPFLTTVATALNLNLSATGTVRANIQGYQAP